ncbi:hypothetical protein JKP88DRAFT_233128 [Tribonema minus]|uniref:Uncharacterized protein n=1 Tax=Tribonema minus TaxID=303371 RepID=A0A835ZIF7_9STRA|nr:hypothetical protein JKP88DRAFT_233128 [Tribonema minus]
MFPGVTNDYGYILSDLVMDELLHGKMEGVAQCDYFMLTNGDNLYSSRLLPSALPYMRTDIDLIGFEFLSHYSIKDNRVDHPGSDQTIHTQFKTLWIDKGAAMFKADTIARLNMTFALGFAREFGRLTTQVLGFKPTRIDGNFFTQLAQTEGVSSVIIRRTLLMHL